MYIAIILGLAIGALAIAFYLKKKSGAKRMVDLFKKD